MVNPRRFSLANVVLVAALAACAPACAPGQGPEDDGSGASDVDLRGRDGEGAEGDGVGTGAPDNRPGHDAQTNNVATLHLDEGQIDFKWEYVDGIPLAEGDIVVPIDGETRSASTSWFWTRWSDARIPYTVSADLPEAQRVTDAIAHWQEKTKLRFVPRTTEGDYVEFRSGTGCSADIGKKGGKQHVNLTTGESSSNVVGHAVDPSSGDIHFFYKRGFQTIGSTTRADSVQPHSKYVLPAGKATTDIVAVSSAPTGRVYAWYKDATVSQGSFTDFGSVNAPKAVTLPAGKTMADVLAIAIDSASKTHAYYTDGTYSVGSTTDLAATSAPAPFTLPAGKTAAQVAHVTVLKDGSFLTHFSGGDTSKGTASALGASGAGARIAFSGNCSTGSTIHEIGHTVGLFHEQTRRDRDDYVDIFYANIESGKSGNFDKHSALTGQDHGAYDFDSIMHYGSFSFSKNGQATILKKDGSQITGQRNTLSAGDITAITSIY